MGQAQKEVQQPMLNLVLLICCSSPHYVILTPLTGGKNLTRHEPYDKRKFGESRADYRLPFYTSGFE